MGMEEKGKITLRVSLSLFYISSSVTWIPYVFFFFGLHPHFGEIHPSVISRKRIHGEKNFFVLKNMFILHLYLLIVWLGMKF